MKSEFSKGLSRGIGIGIIVVLTIFIGIIFAVGFHSASEIVSGVFQGNYTFNGTLSVSQNTTLNGTLIVNNGINLGSETNCNTNNKGTIRYNDVNNTIDYCNGIEWTRFTDMDNYYGYYNSQLETIGSNPSLNGAAATFETWINPGEDLSIGGNYIFGKHQCAYGGWEIYISGGRLTSHHYNSGWHSWNTSSQTWNQGQWYHIAVSRGSGGIKLYINGALITSTADTTSFSEYGSGTAALGGSSIGCGGGYYVGGMDDSRMWTRQLTDSEVRDIYERGRGSSLNISTSNLLWYYVYENDVSDQSNSYDGSGSITFLK